MALVTSTWLSLSVAQAAPPTAEDLFNPSVIHDIRLVMNPADWAELQETYIENTYYPADMRWRDSVVATIGLRSRGLGSRNGHKPGLRLDFNRYVDQKFLGLKALILANGFQDPVLMKQRISMQVFNLMDVPAPRVVHARVFVNDEYIGLYQMIEAVDKNFLARVFGADRNGRKENDGYLYDYAWKDGYAFDYLGPELRIYAELFEPKTHEDEAPEVLYGHLAEFFREFNQVSDRDFEFVVSRYLNLRTFVRFLAVEKFLADIDGFLGNWGANNFYLYRFEGRTDSQFIPWDKDLAFGAPDFDIYQGVEANVLARRVLAIPSMHQAYLETLIACASKSMEPSANDSGMGWLESEVRAQIEQIRDAAMADENKMFSNERFQDEADKVRRFAAERGPWVAWVAQRELEKNGLRSR